MKSETRLAYGEVSFQPTERVKELVLCMSKIIARNSPTCQDPVVKAIRVAEKFGFFERFGVKPEDIDWGEDPLTKAA